MDEPTPRFLPAPVAGAKGRRTARARATHQARAF